MSDDTKALMEWLQGGVSESRAGRMYKRALNTIERLERDRDALAERCEKLREALREHAICDGYCHECDWRISDDGPGETHAPGCLAAPKDAP